MAGWLLQPQVENNFAATSTKPISRVESFGSALAIGQEIGCDHLVSCIDLSEGIFEESPANADVLATWRDTHLLDEKQVAIDPALELAKQHSDQLVTVGRGGSSERRCLHERTQPTDRAINGPWLVPRGRRKTVDEQLPQRPSIRRADRTKLYVVESVHRIVGRTITRSAAMRKRRQQNCRCAPPRVGR